MVQFIDLKISSPYFAHGQLYRQVVHTNVTPLQGCLTRETNSAVWYCVLAMGR